MKTRARRRTIELGSFLLGAVLTLMHVGTIEAQDRWEMRVCADSDNFPISHETRPGFENRVAGILADQLGAEVTYLWTTAAFEYIVEHHLLTGGCDLVMGVGEGVLGLLNTIAYYRSPHVFAFRKDSGFEVRSLDDPLLRELRISTYAGSIPHGALLGRGLNRNVAAVNPLGPRPSASILESVVRGEVQLGLLYGPAAGYFARHESDDLRIVSVSPELDPPLSAMYSTWTIGLRPHDEAFRDRLNIALAERWEEIQALLEEHGVPLIPLPRPRAPESSGGAVRVRVGVVLPMPNDVPRSTDVVASAALWGARITEGWIDRENSGLPLKVSFASAPDSASAARAARRLVATEGVSALVGGVGRDQALALADAAEHTDVLFFNIASSSDALRDSRSHLFHVEASATMYLTGLLDWFAARGQREWFVVYPATDEGDRLHQRTVESLGAPHLDGSVLESAAVPPGGHVYHGVLDRMREADAAAVLLLLAADDQESFLAQYERSGLHLPVVGFPDPVSQTRDFYARFRQVAPTTGTGFRAALWETTLGGEAEELNNRFIGRSGEPMDPTAWAAYAAVKIVYDAVAATSSIATSTLIEYLEGPEAAFDLQKGEPLSFRRDDHQLAQPLYLVRIDPEAVWGPQVSRRVDLAELVDELPSREVARSSP